MDATKLWKLQWNHKDTIQFLDYLIKDTATAARESHYHELWNEVFIFFCKAFKSETATISCIPQYELCYRPDDNDGAGRGQGGNSNPNVLPGEQYVLEEWDLEEGQSLESVASSFSATINAVTVEDKDNVDKKPVAKWKRPDYLVMGRIFEVIRGVSERKLGIKRPLLLVELKRDPKKGLIAFVKAGEEPNAEHVPGLAFVTLLQVLKQAQFVFAEFPDAGDKIHAIIAVGTFCMDFTILKDKLPEVDHDDAEYDPRGTIQDNFGNLREYVENVSDRPYHILNKNRDGFHPKFLAAWEKARDVSPEFLHYN
ncbi:hypothetical protein SCHPADRAFT_889000 [Schizopora paradoxa]|uniref:Uncharacterized protein n=1 Tax=Schizopora paradoxa TaxID=27342 RepID=A0A0H2RT94_9AGAM|nr:hypothetical protein SCHPADRAFT_889000 [Schizopora paradoxa]